MKRTVDELIDNKIDRQICRCQIDRQTNEICLIWRCSVLDRQMDIYILDKQKDRQIYYRQIGRQIDSYIVRSIQIDKYIDIYQIDKYIGDK